MRKLAAPLSLMALGAFVCVSAGQPPQSQRSNQNNQTDQTNADAKFAKEAACGGRAEVLLGQLAVKKAASPAVREFGQRMVRDHSMANRQLMGIASREGLTLPRQVSEKDQKTIDHLSQLQGPEFDRAYMHHMLKDHKHDLAAFKKQAKEGQDPALKQFATKTLPILEEHMQMAEKTDRLIGGQGNQNDEHNR